MTQKLYCYVDETGQDTQGERVKWIKTRYDRRLAYIRRVLQQPIFQGKLNFAIYRDTREYLSLTVQTVAQAILIHAQEPYKATVLIDGLPRSQRAKVGTRLRRLGVRIRKVRGVRKDESDALIRLADALCGFVRAASEGQEAMKQLFEWGKKAGYLCELEVEVKEKNPLG